jgi:hypothetical protein
MPAMGSFDSDRSLDSWYLGFPLARIGSHILLNGGTSFHVAIARFGCDGQLDTDFESISGEQEILKGVTATPQILHPYI